MSEKAGHYFALVFCSALLAAALAEPSLDGQEGELLGHWVVSVPQGLDRARRLSEDHSLDFLGEVIPTSIHQSLSSHPGTIQVLVLPTGFFFE
jgi:hypothetical protein